MLRAYNINCIDATEASWLQSTPESCSIHRESIHMQLSSRLRITQIACGIVFGNKIESILVVIPLKVADVNLNISAALQQELDARYFGTVHNVEG